MTAELRQPGLLARERWSSASSARTHAGLGLVLAGLGLLPVGLGLALDQLVAAGVAGKAQQEAPLSWFSEFERQFLEAKPFY